MAERHFKYFHQGNTIDVTEVPIKTMSESVSTYDLEDGTRLSARTVVAAVLRVDGQYDQEGNPQYLLKSQIVVAATEVPAQLRKPE